MTFLFRRALLLAKSEAQFRTDALPHPTAISISGADSSATDTNDTTEEIENQTSHGFTDGDRVRVSIDSGNLPSPLVVDTDYYLMVSNTAVPADNFAFYTTLAGVGAELDDPTDTSGRIALTVDIGTFSVAMQTSDAMLVEEPDFAPDITVLERNNARVTLSPEPVVVARKIATVTFAHEVRNNGITDGLTPPALGVLLRGCGMAQTRFGETGNLEETILDDAAIQVNEPTGRFTYTKTTAYAGTLPRVVVLQCTTPGGSGVAAFTVYSPAVGSVQTEVNNTGQVMTDAGTFALAESAELTIDASGISTNFATGDTYVINLAPAGHSYEPISESFESLTLKVYYGEVAGAILHTLSGSRGTFTVDGEAADFARFNFTFTGDYVDPVDSTLPATATTETTLPTQVDLANLTALGGKDFDGTDPTEFNLCAQAFNIDIGNNVVPRACINDQESLAGAVITARLPVGSFNPESVLEAEHPFWSILSDGDLLFWNVRVGKVQGNVVVFTAPQAQYSEIAYGNRDDIRIYDVTTALRTNGADDELRIVFA